MQSTRDHITFPPTNHKRAYRSNSRVENIEVFPLHDQVHGRISRKKFGVVSVCDFSKPASGGGGTGRVGGGLGGGEFTQS